MSDAYRTAVNNQRAAADPAQSVFVVANAGSGKTKVLVDRIARLLLGGAAPSAFLCITFTKAAAAEMQRRLIERLGDWCVADDKTLSGQLVELGEPAPDRDQLARARALFARALETPGGLRIQTIHGFCERLIARFPLEAGVPPGFEIAEESRASALIALAWARVVERAEGAAAAALDRFGAGLYQEAFDGLVATLAARRERIADLVAREGGPDAARAAILARHGVSGSAESIAAALVQDVDWGVLGEMHAVLAASGKADREIAERIALARRQRTAQALADIFIKDDGAPYKTLCTKAVVSKHPALLAAYEAIRRQTIEAQAQINAAGRAADAAAALTLGYALADTYAAVKADAGALDFEDLIVRAHGLLGASESAPWVLYKLDGALAHILIDEGQDTSPAQWRLIAPLQAEFFAGAGAARDDRTVFAVGDPKQSIFSFQGADPGQFIEESQALESRARAAEKPFAAPTMTMSFRSTPEVLRAVDETFEGLAIADGPFGGEVIAHQSNRPNEAGRVEWWPLAPAPKRKEAHPWSAPQDADREATSVAVLCAALAQQVKGWIDAGEGVWEKGALRPMRPGDVLALVRQRGPLFAQLLKSMKRVGLPVAGPDRMTLAQEISVQDLLAAMRVALDPTDDLSLATLLKSPWIGLTRDDEDIFPLLHERGRARVIDCLRAATDPRYAPARSFVEGLIADAGAHPHAFLSRILERADEAGLSGWETMLARLGVAARDPVEELLSRALRCGRSGPATLHHFVRAVETDELQVKRETEQGADAVRVMTVHGAKGLEAPVVLLADTAAGPNTRADGNLYMTSAGLVVRGARGSDDAVVAAAREEAERAALHEHRRLLYVAMTRARDRLIVCGAAHGGHKTTGSHDEAWSPAVAAGLKRAGARPCETPFGEGLALGETFAAPRAAAADPAAVEIPDWARRAAPDATAPASIAPSLLAQAHGPVLSPRGDAHVRFRRGALIHGLLQRLPDAAPARRAGAAAAWLAARGVTGELAAAYAGEALRVLDDASFAAVFGPGSRAEAPIVATLADGVVVRGAIDRLLVTPAEILALDYKTDRPPPDRPEDTPERILAQMAAYRAALALIFPGRPVDAAILWTDGPLLMPLPAGLLDAVRPADARG